MTFDTAWYLFIVKFLQNCCFFKTIFSGETLLTLLTMWKNVSSAHEYIVLQMILNHSSDPWWWSVCMKSVSHPWIKEFVWTVLPSALWYLSWHEVWFWLHHNEFNLFYGRSFTCINLNFSLPALTIQTAQRYLFS